MEHESGNSQLLNDYRAALINAYYLGEEIKELYGIVPPKVISEKIKNNNHKFGTPTNGLLTDRIYNYVPDTVVIGLVVS